MKWTEARKGYMTATVGPLFAYVQGNGGYKAPDHPDHEPERFNWFVAPDNEDKNDRRALAEGCSDTMDTAKHAVELALHQIIEQMHKDLHG